MPSAPARRLPAMLAVALLLPVAAATAASSRHRVTARSGAVAATLSYLRDRSSVTAPYSGLRLTIAVHGRRAYAGAIRAQLCGRHCWPAAGIGGSAALRVARLDGNRLPEVIVDLYSGGAHCCSITQVYRHSGRGFARSQHDFLDPGARLRRLGGTLRFISADDRFAYTFAPYAFSGLPLAIWSFRGGRFLDTTREFPALIAADAARQYRAFRANRAAGMGLGFIAAWAADEDLLGHERLVARTLAAQRRAGALRSSGGFGRQGAAFVEELQRFLVKTGYRS